MEESETLRIVNSEELNSACSETEESNSLSVYSLSKWKTLKAYRKYFSVKMLYKWRKIKRKEPKECFLLSFITSLMFAIGGNAS